jgi:hypothetical protein
MPFAIWLPYIIFTALLAPQDGAKRSTHGEHSG